MRCVRALILVLSLFFIALSGQECSLEELNRNFPESVVRETLANAKVPGEYWESIVIALNAQENKIQEEVKARAAKMSPNPFNPPVRSVDISRLYREVLKSAFMKAIKDHTNIESDFVVSDLFDQFLLLKADKFYRCGK